MKAPQEEEDLMRVAVMASAAVLPMVMKTAIQLNLFKIMAQVTKNGDGGQFTSLDIASHVPTQNPTQTQTMIERILWYLATRSILTSKIITDDESGKPVKLFAMTSICKFFATNEEASSMSNMFLFLNDKAIMESWHHLKDAVLEGGTAFNMAHGENIFEYQAKDKKLAEIFDKAMEGGSAIFMKLVLDKYNGFERVKKMVDVGGGLGATLRFLVSKYPGIKGINFDMPHVIKDAPSVPGVEHVGGDMFHSVPKGDVILLQRILHDWGDDYCIKLLKNCWVSLPKDGKVIVIEAIMPDDEEKNDGMPHFDGDMLMLALFPGGKERTAKEYGDLATKSGFSSSKIVCRGGWYSIMEFNKTS